MHPKAARNLMLTAFAAESFSVSYGLLYGKQAALVSILYIISGLALVFSMLFLPEARLHFRSGPKLLPDAPLKAVLALLMIWLAYITASYWLFRIPVDPDYADMLPVIRVMNERFFSGHWKQVYDPIPEIWHGIRPIYMPAIWLPYGLTMLPGLDMRWITVFALLFCFGLFLVLIRFRSNSHAWPLLAIAAMLFWWIFSQDEVHGLISLSEEGPVILYHVLLCLAIASGNIYCIAVSASLCLLSRYAMIGWLPPFLLMLLVQRRYRKCMIFLLTVLLFFLLFFLIPFGSGPVRQMIHLPSGYIAFAARVWKDSPEVFWLNPGLAKFFGPQRTALLHHILLLSCFALPLLFTLACTLPGKRKKNNISLAAFKLSLILFFNLIDVPYGYLFYTASLVSLMIAVMLLLPPAAGGSHPGISGRY